MIFDFGSLPLFTVLGDVGESVLNILNPLVETVEHTIHSLFNLTSNLGIIVNGASVVFGKIFPDAITSAFVAVLGGVLVLRILNRA